MWRTVPDDMLAAFQEWARGEEARQGYVSADVSKAVNSIPSRGSLMTSNEEGE